MAPDFRLSKFLDPLHKGFANKGIPAAEAAVGKLVADQERSRSPLGKHGQLMLATENTAQNITIAIIDPATGMQIGYAQAADVTHHIEPLRLNNQPIYTTEFVIDDGYRGLGFGTLARTYMEKLLSDRHPNGVLLGDTIQAQGETSRRAMKKILDNSGSQATELSRRLQRTRDESWVFKILDHHQSDAPLTITINDITFSNPNSKNFSLPKGFELDSEQNIIYDGLKIGLMTNQGIKLLPPGQELTPEGYDRDYEHWEAMSNLWSSLIANGLRPKLDKE